MTVFVYMRASAGKRGGEFLARHGSDGKIQAKALEVPVKMEEK